MCVVLFCFELIGWFPELHPLEEDQSQVIVGDGVAKLVPGLEVFQRKERTRGLVCVAFLSRPIVVHDATVYAAFAIAEKPDPINIDRGILAAGCGVVVFRMESIREHRQGQDSDLQGNRYRSRFRHLRAALSDSFGVNGERQYR